MRVGPVHYNGTGEIDIDKVTVAIAEFEKTLVTPNSRFDLWLLGDADAQWPIGFEFTVNIGQAVGHIDRGAGRVARVLAELILEERIDLRRHAAVGASEHADDRRLSFGTRRAVFRVLLDHDAAQGAADPPPAATERSDRWGSR